MLWPSFFVWFLTLSFIYVPYGKQSQQIIGEHLPSWASIDESMWAEGVIQVNEMFITPLVVTQVKNLQYFHHLYNPLHVSVFLLVIEITLSLHLPFAFSSLKSIS